MEWTDLDWEAERWKVPAKKMKMRQPHIVPLASQSVEVLRQIHLFSGSGDYVFYQLVKAAGRSAIMVFLLLCVRWATRMSS